SYFIGTVTNITFISSAPIMDINGRVHPIEIQAIQDKKNWTLRYREGARYSDLGRGIKWSNPWIELLTQLKKVKFTYLAPAFPLPVELDPRWLDDDEKLRYRDVPTWVSHYDCRQRGLYPTQIAIKFTDKQDIEHQWLFSPPTASDAWSMGFYETD
ncbi:MAG: hypothetical protein KAG86_09640, partial [Gammaproteobacteria bacterium]|nr:hypothetical protein [Gammaproteobacteria bacterium]